MRPLLWQSVLVGMAALVAPAATSSQSATGSLEGRVRLEGPAPANPLIRMGADPKCARINAGTRRRQEIVLRSDDGGLANAFVYLAGPLPSEPPPATPVRVDQRNCLYTPRVVGVQVGQRLRFENSDPTVHNVHGVSLQGNDFNTSQPQAGLAFEVRPTKPEVMLRVKCDIHSWMVLYVGVVDHPYFAVTDETGRFRIDRIPAGWQTVQVWHEYYGSEAVKVEIKPGSTAAVELVYAASAKG